MRFCRSVSVLVCVFALVASFPTSAQVNVLTYHNDLSRSGQNLNETLLSPANVNTNTFGRLFAYAVDGYVYAQPLYVSGVSIPGQGTHNVVFVATQHNSVYAFDADGNAGVTGSLLWQTNLGPSAAVPNNDFGNRYGPYSDITPEVGITSTPVIDPATGTIYVDALTHEGSSYYHRIHALSITKGTEQSYSPVLVTASVAGTGVDSVSGIVSFNPVQELQRSALTLAGGKLYEAYAGYADTDPYHGWVIGFDASTLQQLTNYTFNDTPNSSVAAFGVNAGEGGIWMSGCGLSVDAQTNLYVITGNGSFNATNGLGGTELGDSFIKLSSSNRLAAVDYFTPYNQAYLAANDLDLGSGGAVLLPDSVGSAAHPHLLVSCGKEGTIYLIDRDNMGHYQSVSDSQIVQKLPSANNGTWSSAAYFNGWIYFQGSGDVGSYDVMKAYAISNALMQTTPISQSTTSFGFPGATPSVSANGTNNAIVWAVQTDGFSSGLPSILHAYDAYNLAHELYNSQQAGSRDQLGVAVKFAVPTVANGKVYVGSEYTLSVFGLLNINVPPVLPAQPSPWTIIQPSTLVVTNTATDANLPAQTLTYTLLVTNVIGGSVQSNALISTNGIISWTPTPAQAPGIYTFTTVVTDNGVPPLSATNSFTVQVLTNNLVLPQQPNQTINELTTLTVTNTAIDLNPDAPVVSGLATNSIYFTYTNRSALVADGWSLTATNGVGAARNTEITDTNVGVILYAQTNGSLGTVLRVPCDVGDLWAAANNTRNSLFRSLPTNWVSMRLALSFAPSQNYQQAQLALYQDDDNYVEIGRSFNTYNGNQEVEFDREIGQVPTTPGTAGVTATNVSLRLDQNIGNGNVGGYYSTDGVNWVLVGQSSQNLSNTRLCIWVGGATNAFANTHLRGDLSRLNVITTNSTVLLTYTLAVTNTADGSAVNNAVIDTNGVITWTPTEAQVPGTYTFTTTVSDGITTSANSFTVTVEPASNEFNIESIELSNSVVTVTWISVAGQSYSLQYKDSLTDTIWNVLPPDVMAAGSLTSTTNVVGGLTQRFYRIQLVSPVGDP